MRTSVNEWHTPAMNNETHQMSAPERYNEASFWHKLTHHARRAGRATVETALQLHYAALRPDTPAWARSTAYGALAYFILPLDTVPDWLVAVGYTDDLAALTLAVSTLASYVDDDVRQRARERLQSWFGP